MESNTWRN